MSDAEQLVKTYLTIRAERENLKAKFDAEDGKLKGDMSAIEAALLALCGEVNTSGLRTTFGTVTRTIKDRFFCTDWEQLKKFIEQEGNIDLLERRIHQRNFKDFMSERQGDGLPPGVNVLREYDIVVRKASNTVDQ
jgi:hypothetical protein